MDVERKEIPSKGQVNANSAAAWTALGLSILNGGNGGGGSIVDRFLGGGHRSEDPAINRYEANLLQTISALEAKIELRDANTYTMGEMAKLRDYVDAKFASVNDKLGAQAVHNATCDALLGCINGQVAQLFGLTKLVVPNTSVCPGWGNVTVAPATAAAA